MSDSLSEILLSDEQYEIISKLSAAGHSFKDIALYLQIRYSIFKQMMEDKTSKIYEAYYRGQLIIKAQIDLSLADNAIGGSVTAVQIQMKRQENIDFINIKSQVWDI